MGLDKYYCPDKEEFFIGFEYEEFHDPIRYKIINNQLNNWNKKVFNLDTHLYYNTYNGLNQIVSFFDCDIKDKFRVKYLDCEDIIDLGWREKHRKYYYIELPASYPYYLYAILDFRWGYEDISIDVVRSHEYRNEDDQERIFRGVIKNKSELKKLLKQLKINE